MFACSTCGQENPAGAKFCLECGTRLAEAAPPPPEAIPAAREERKLVTVLFTDIVGSTATAEQLDPEDVRARLRPYYERVRAELESHGGTVEKFIGDAVVAVFGAPIAHEDDPERAVRAALAVRAAVAELNAGDEWLDLHLRTAVHTGEALVVLDAREGEGLAAGDVMNTAARLQSGAPVDGIVVGEATHRATARLFEYRKAEPIIGKGKAEPIAIWEVYAALARGPRPELDIPLIGRTEELEQLLQLHNRVMRRRRPELVIVVAPPGMGKSTLLAAMCQRIEADATVHWGRCLSYGEGMTYWPVVEMLTAAAGVSHGDDPATISAKLGELLERLSTTDSGELRTMATALANLFGVPATPRGTYAVTDISQAELHWGICRIFQLLAGTRPLLLAFEDIHWAEPTLFKLISDLEHIEDAPIMLVASGRPELRAEHRAFASPDTIRHLIELDALDPQESSELLGALVGDLALSPEASEALLANSGGNPLFLEETVRMLADSGLLGTETPLEGLAVPDSLQALIGARLDALPTREKAVAQQASVVGSVFWLGAVAHLAQTNGDLLEPMTTLERRDMVRPRDESTIAGDREWMFKHVLIRDVAYERLPKGARAGLHVRFAEWLTALPTGDEELIEILAHHLEQACRLTQSVRTTVPAPVLEAVAALRRSAEKAERREGLREADRFYARALELLDSSHEDSALELQLRRGATLLALGEVAEAERLLTEVERAARSINRLEVLCEALIELGDTRQRRGQAAEARAHLVEADRLARQIDHPRLRVRSAFVLGELRADFEGASAEVAQELQGAVAQARRLGDDGLTAEGHLRIAALRINLGQLEAAEQELRRCLDLARALGSHRVEAQATAWLGQVLFYRGQTEEGEQLGLEARDWLRRTGDSYFEVQNLVRGLGVFALSRGEPVAAEEWLREALPTALEIGGWVVVETYRFLVEALVRQDRLDDARELIQFAGRDLPPEDTYARASVLIAEASLALAGGDAAGAGAKYEESLRLLEGSNWPVDAAETRIALADALLTAGEGEAARAALEEARSSFDTMGAAEMVSRVDRRLAEPALTR